MNIRQKYIATISDYFKNQPVKKVYLFGSQIRNEAKEDSDIDILVELDYSQPIGLKFIKMKLELQDILKRKVDLLSNNAVSKHIRSQIEKEKYLIYER